MGSLPVPRTILLLLDDDGGTAEGRDLVQQDGDLTLPVLLHALEGFRHRLRGPPEVVDLSVALSEKRLESANVGGDLFWRGFSKNLKHPASEF